MTNLETWVSLAALALIVMFIALIFSFIIFLIGPKSQGPNIDVQPAGVVIQIVSISGAPGIILSGVTYGLARNAGARSAGIILIVSGVILAAGMAYIGISSSEIPENYRIPFLDTLRYAFLAAGMGIVVVGVILLKNPRIHTKLGDEKIW